MVAFRFACSHGRLSLRESSAQRNNAGTALGGERNNADTALGGGDSRLPIVAVSRAATGGWPVRSACNRRASSEGIDAERPSFDSGGFRLARSVEIIGTFSSQGKLRSG